VGTREGGEAPGEDHVPAHRVHLPGTARRRTGSRGSFDLEGALGTEQQRDTLATIVVALRWSTLVVGVLLALPDLGPSARVKAATVLLTLNAAIRTFRPLRATLDSRPLTDLLLLVDLAVALTAVGISGGWSSPFVFTILVDVFLAGFGRGFAEGLMVGIMAGAVISAIHLATQPLHQWVTTASQILLVFELTGLLAGYARRLFVEAEERHGVAVDRMAQLADANALLLALHDVAQSLPSSLDLDEALASARLRLRELFDFTAAALLVRDPGSGNWRTGFVDGVRLPQRVALASLPQPVQTALSSRSTALETDLHGRALQGLSPRSRSALYTPLVTRGRLVGLVALEHIEPERFGNRELELMRGLLEPLALAVDNALWFARLRSLGAEEERTRIARELHDRTAQSLAYVGFELDRLSARHPDDPDVARLRDDVRQLTSEVRETLYELRANVSDTADLRATAEEYLPRFSERTRIPITFAPEVDGPRLPSRIEQELWRILQESLRNIERHSGAEQAWVHWETNGTRARLEVVDDGEGFDPLDEARIDSYGLRGMFERADSIGARLTIDAEPGRGTRITVEVEARV
jgi:signal transduction histidine kinase